MSAVLMTLAQSLVKGPLIIPVQQSYSNAFALGRWLWLVKKNNKLWVDLVGINVCCIETGRSLGGQQLTRSAFGTEQFTMEAESA